MWHGRHFSGIYLRFFFVNYIFGAWYLIRECVDTWKGPLNGACIQDIQFGRHILLHCRYLLRFISPISLTCIFLCISLEQVSSFISEDAFHIAFFDIQSFTEYWEAHVHSDQIAAFRDLQQLCMLESVAQLPQEEFLNLILLGFSSIGGGQTAGLLGFS